MNKKCCKASLEIPVAELSQQIDYARTTGADICEFFACPTPSVSNLLANYEVMRTKISMLQDFLFQAKLWCDILLPDENFRNVCKKEKENE